jgi:hypothetical protein
VLARLAGSAVANVALLSLLLGGCGDHSAIVRVSAGHAPLETPNSGGQFACGWDANGVYDDALSGFENTTATGVRILSATPHSEGGLVVEDIFLERPGTVAQAQPGFSNAPIRSYRTNQPVATIPITSTIPAHKWVQFVVRVRLGSHKQSGVLQSVTLTFVVKGQQYRTDYDMPYALCRSAAPSPTAPLAAPTTSSCCAP